MDLCIILLPRFVCAHTIALIHLNSKVGFSSFQLLAVVRAHVTALGGNAMVSFYMSELTLVDNPHKNQVDCLCPQRIPNEINFTNSLLMSISNSQGQTLISVGGDVVFVSYFSGYDHNAAH